MIILKKVAQQNQIKWNHFARGRIGKLLTQIMTKHYHKSLKRNINYLASDGVKGN